VLAAALDPRFKNLKFLTDDLEKLVRGELSQRKNTDFGNLTFQYMAVEETELSETPPTKKKKNSIRYTVLLGDENDSEGSEDDTEVEEVLIEKSLPCNSDVLVWWNMIEHRFLRLAKIAKIYLGMPATYICLFREIVFKGRNNYS